MPIEDQPTVLAFQVEWYDENAAYVRKYRLNVFADQTLEMMNESTKQNFLKRIHYPSLTPAQLYLGSRFTVLSRCLEIVEFADEGTRKWCNANRSRAVGLLALPSAASLGAALDALMRKGFSITQAKTIPPGVAAARCGLEVAAGAPCALALAVDAHAIGGGGPAKLLDAFTELGELGVATGSAPVPPEGAETDEAVELLFHTRAVGNSYSESDEQTLCVVKPHLLRQAHNAEVLAAIEAGGFEVVCAELFVLNKSQATEFFDVYKGVLKEYADVLPTLVDGPCLALQICQKGGGVVESFREFVGPADVEIAGILRPNSLRAKFGKSRVLNGLHCTDLEEDGDLECHYFFQNLSAKLI